MSIERGNTDRAADLAGMTEQGSLADLLSATGTATVAYIDGRGPRPQIEEEAARDAVVARLEEAGAPAADVAAISAALPAKDGTPSPSARYLLARDGAVVVDEVFPGARLGPERTCSGPVPEIVPLLRHLARGSRYLVIETGREGAEIRLERGDRHAPELAEEVEGRADSLTKVQAGGWSHARYQRAAEEVWKHNQSEVAAAVDRLVEEQRPDFIVLAGDVRARQVLRDRLGEAALRLVTEYESHTRADGADEDGLANAISEIAEQRIRDEIASVVDRARADDGSAGAEGVSAVVDALQQARVDTLVLDAGILSDERTLRALDAQPWVADAEHGEFDAATLAEVPLSEGLARAAVLTGARVLFREEESDAPDEPRGPAATPEPIAALRWAEGSV